jgi:hypothetical protein
LWGQVGENKINLQDLGRCLTWVKTSAIKLSLIWKKFVNMAAHITTDTPSMKESNEFASKALQ